MSTWYKCLVWVLGMSAWYCIDDGLLGDEAGLMMIFFEVRGRLSQWGQVSGFRHSSLVYFRGGVDLFEGRCCHSRRGVSRYRKRCCYIIILILCSFYRDFFFFQTFIFEINSTSWIHLLSIFTRDRIDWIHYFVECFCS